MKTYLKRDFKKEKMIELIKLVYEEKYKGEIPTMV